VGSDGLIKTATTNLLLRSEEFGDVFWTLSNATVSTNQATSPIGTVTADKLITNNAASGGQLFSTTTLLASTTYTFSCYAKAAEWSWLRLTTRGPENSDIGAYFNLATGTVGTTDANVTATIQNVSGGWYRCVVTRTTGTGATAARQRIYATNADNALSTGDGTSGIYIWGAQLEQSSTVGEYIPTTSTINSAPRFDHNPTTGESLGLLVEEQRTNSVRNNTMVGAVAGTPGTNPTNWGYVTTQSNGLTQTIVGTGTENGINYIDYRFNGTTVASPNAIAFGIEGIAGVATTGQTWTGAVYLRLANGTLTGVNSTQIGLIESTSGGSFVGGALYTISPPTSAALISQRATATRILSGGATVGICALTLSINVVGSTAMDFTIRIGMPQLEQGAFATSVIPTTTATVTRSADVASISGSNFSSWYRQDEGTFFGSFNPTKGNVLFGVGNTFNDTAYVTNFASNNVSIRSNNLQSALISAAVSTTAITNLAFGLQQNNFAACSNGGSLSIDTSGDVPASQVRLTFGQSSWLPADGTNNINGTIRRITYWPTRLPNSTLQQITR
jgi:hypothetical protein